MVAWPAQGDRDISLCGPDGSNLRNITRTPEFNVAGRQFSRDGGQRWELVGGDDGGTVAAGSSSPNTFRHNWREVE